MTTTHGVAPFPLYWPLAHSRTEDAQRREAHFRVDFATARAQLLRELALLHARDVVLSTNIPVRKDGLPSVPDREPVDPGVAVYFLRAGKPFVIACDHFSRIRWNLRAIGATLEALRSIERHSTTTMLEQAFSGFAALPAKSAPPKPWPDVLGVPPSAPRDQIRARYLELVREHHPDRGGDHARMTEINTAYFEALGERP